MSVFIVTDVLAAVAIVVGFLLAFRPSLVRRLLAHRGVKDAPPPGEGPDGLASVLRIAGVMLMAFSFTLAAFAHLIAFYTAQSRLG